MPESVAHLVSFPWVNGGKPFVLPDLPMAGDDEIDVLTERNARTLTARRQSHLLTRLLLILAVKKTLDLGKPDRAYKAWLEALPTVEPPQSQDLFRWTLETFPTEFESYFAVEVETRYGVTGYEEANAYLKERTEALKKDYADLTPLHESQFHKDRLVTDLYWRLKGQFKTLTLDGQEVPITKENLRQVIRYPSDWTAYATALVQNRTLLSPEAEREEYHEDLSEEDVKKNSQSSESSGKPSRTASPSTSETGTGPGTPSVTSTPTAGRPSG